MRGWWITVLWVHCWIFVSVIGLRKLVSSADQWINVMPIGWLIFVHAIGRRWIFVSLTDWTIFVSDIGRVLPDSERYKLYNMVALIWPHTVSKTVPYTVSKTVYCIIWNMFLNLDSTVAPQKVPRPLSTSRTWAKKRSMGQCHEITCFRFFSWIIFLQAPENNLWVILNFFENSPRYSQVKVHYWHQRHRQ